MASNAEIRAHYAEELAIQAKFSKWIRPYGNQPVRRIDGLTRRSWIQYHGTGRTELAVRLVHARHFGLPKPQPDSAPKTLGTRWRWESADYIGPWRNDRDVALIQDGFGRVGFLRAEVETSFVDIARYAPAEAGKLWQEDLRIEKLSAPMGDVF